MSCSVCLALRRFLPAVGLAVGGFLQTLVPAATPPAEKWLPEETIAYFTVPNLAAARPAWAQQAPGAFWNDPAMRPFRQHLEGEIARHLWQPLEQLTGLPPTQLLDLAEGQITLVILATPPGPAPSATASPVLLLDVGSHTNALAALLANAAARATNLAAAPTRVPIGGLDFLALRWPAAPWDDLLQDAFPRPDPAPSPTPASAPVTWFLGRQGSCFVAATTTNALPGILARLGGAAPALTGHPSFAADAARFTNTLAHAWLNAPRALPYLAVRGDEPATPGTPATARSGPSPARIIAALGLNQVQSASLRLRTGADGWRSDVRISVPAADRKGLFKILDLRPADASPPPWVPDTVLSFTRVRIPGTAAWKAFERVLLDMDPSFLGVLQLFTQYAGKTEDADFDFDRGFVDKLGDDWLKLAMSIPHTNTWGSDLLAHGSTNAAALYQAIAKIASPTYLSTFFPPDTPAPARLERSVLGHRVTSIAMPPMPWRDGAQGTYHLAERDGYVGLTGTGSSIQVFLASTNVVSPLAQQPAFVDAVQRAGGAQGGWLGYYLEREAARQAFLVLHHSQQPLHDLLHWAALSEVTTRLVAGLLQSLDFDLLPPFDAVSRYFQFRVECGHTDERGLELATFRPAPTPVRVPPPLPVQPPPAPTLATNAPAAAPIAPPRP